MTMIFFLVFLVALLLPDLYIWLSFVRGSVHMAWSAVYWLPTVAALALLAAGAAGHMHEWIVKLFFGIVLCIALPKMVFALLSLILRAAGAFLPTAAAAGTAVAAAAALAAAALFIYGFAFGWKRIVVRHTAVASPRLPAAFDGYRITQISDLHAGTYGSDTAFMRRLVEEVNATDPDLVVFTGDLVNVSAEEIAPFVGTLSRIRARDGVMSILGNHDYCEYRRYDTRDGAARNLAEVKRGERRMGWDLLLDEHRILRRGADSIAVAGVENSGRPPFPSRGDLRKALEGLPDGMFKILLSHDPSHWRYEVLPESDVDLTLSGHTHAVQLRIGGFSPAKWVYPEWGGIYREGRRTLHVSTGIGGTVPFRLGAWPEIDVLTLERADG